MASDLPRFTLRISSELLSKISYIAEENGRSTNREIEMLIKKYVGDYEKKNGIILPEGK
ncbi:MAG: Arc family DNA-binding protein [Chitinophagales bacterium]